MSTQEKKTHDGNLGGDGRYTVSHDKVFNEPTVDIKGDINYVDMEDMVSLTPKEALSLLAWLEQERETLEKLVKEQGDE